jgi:hypothetical protein
LLTYTELAGERTVQLHLLSLLSIRLVSRSDSISHFDTSVTHTTQVLIKSVSFAHGFPGLLLIQAACFVEYLTFSHKHHHFAFTNLMDTAF